MDWNLDKWAFTLYRDLVQQESIDKNLVYEDTHTSITSNNIMGVWGIPRVVMRSYTIACVDCDGWVCAGWRYTGSSLSLLLQCTPETHGHTMFQLATVEATLCTSMAHAHVMLLESRAYCVLLKSGGKRRLVLKSLSRAFNCVLLQLPRGKTGMFNPPANVPFSPLTMRACGALPRSTVCWVWSLWWLNL